MWSDQESSPRPLTLGRRNESMWSDQESSPRPLTLESDALPTALHGPVRVKVLHVLYVCNVCE